MSRPGKRSLRLVAAALLAAPVLWGLVLALLPMGWARDAVVRAAREATGHEVRLAKVRLRPFGGVRLSGLEIAAPDRSSDPWLKVASADVDLSARDLFTGRVRPTSCRLSGAEVRIHRDASGQLEIEGLIRPSTKPKGAGNQSTAAEPAPALAFSLSESRVTVLDDATETRLEMTEVQGSGTRDGDLLDLPELSGRVNGGTFSMSSKVDRSSGTALEGHIEIRGAALGMGTRAMAYFLPLLAPAGDARVEGTLDLLFEVQARGRTPDEVARSLNGAGTVALEGLTLEGSRIMAEVHRHVPILRREGLASLEGTFRVERRRVETGDTVLRIGDAPVDLIGWSDFDGKLDYLVRCERIGQRVTKIADRLPPEARGLLAELPLEELTELTQLRITGTIEHPRVRPASRLLGPNARKASPERPASMETDREKLRAAGRRLLDRVLR